MEPTPRLVVLDVDQCLELLAGSQLGRLAFVRGDKPDILPLTYRFHEGVAVFRTGWGELIDHVHGRAVAFEIDGDDPVTRTGWSVVVHGKGDEIWQADELERARLLPLEPWAPGTRDHYVRILPTAISGRRITVDDHDSD